MREDLRRSSTLTPELRARIVSLLRDSELKVIAIAKRLWVIEELVSQVNREEKIRRFGSQDSPYSRTAPTRKGSALRNKEW